MWKSSTFFKVYTHKRTQCSPIILRQTSSWFGFDWQACLMNFTSFCQKSVYPLLYVPFAFQINLVNLDLDCLAGVTALWFIYRSHIKSESLTFLTADVLTCHGRKAQVELITVTMAPFQQLLQCNAVINFISNSCRWQVKMSAVKRGCSSLVWLYMFLLWLCVPTAMAPCPQFGNHCLK